MKTTIKTKTLLSVIQNLVKVIPAKTATPILENFLIMASDNALGILASDSETSLSATIPVGEEQGCTVIEKGKAAVPAKLLLEMIKQVEDESVTLTAGETSAEISWAKGRSSLPAFDTKDYPEIILSIKEGTELEISGEELSQALNSTIYAVTEDTTRPVLNGILFNATKDGLTLVSTDSHRLSIRSIPSVKADQSGCFILPKKNAGIVKNLADGAASVRIRFNENNAIFNIDGLTVVSVRTIIGKYPRYRDVIPKRNTSILTVNPASLSAVIRRVSVCANKASNHIQVKLLPDSTGAVMEITAKDTGFALAAFEKISADYAGDPITIGFKANFLIDMLNTFSDETIQVKFEDQKHAVLAEPEKTEERKSYNQCILMPIMVQ